MGGAQGECSRALSNSLRSSALCSVLCLSLGTRTGTSRRTRRGLVEDVSLIPLQSVLGHGYLHRQITRARSRHDLPDDENEDEDEPNLEDDDDPATTPSSRVGNARSNVVVVEHDVVFSRTYRCPMLCLRAWAEGGWDQPRCDADTQLQST